MNTTNTPRALRAAKLHTANARRFFEAAQLAPDAETKHRRMLKALNAADRAADKLRAAGVDTSEVDALWLQAEAAAVEIADMNGWPR